MATTTSNADPADTPAADTSPADQTLSVDDFINLANYAYTSGKKPSEFPLTDYEPLKYANGYDVERGVTADGFYGQAFISTNAADPNVIIAFEGTNLHDPPSSKFLKAQILDDKDIFEGKNPKAYYAALNFTLNATRAAEAQGVSSSNIYVDGHSLGGAEAEYVAGQLNLPGYTFGAPGIPSSDAIYNPSSLTDFADYGDPVGNYSADPPRPLGSLVQSNSILHVGTEQYVGSTSNGALLTKIADEWSGNLAEKGLAVGNFALGFEEHHLLSHYADDLSSADGTSLIKPDGSIGADVAFLAAIKSVLIPGLSVPTEFSAAAVCFASGTHIKTARGDVVVERLSTDDQVVTASGERRAIRWLGHRLVDCRRHPRPRDVWPVRIAAHAFGPNKPARDLLVSPGHAICVDVGGEILVPASSLINGTSIKQIEVDAVTYWHVELESHDILLAENLPAESYLDMGNRGFFVEAEVLALHGVPDAQQRSHADFCRPFVASGPLVDAVKARLRQPALRVKQVA